MMKLIFIVFNILAVPTLSHASVAEMPAQLRYSYQFIFEQVLLKKNLNLRPEVQLPVLFFASKTPLSQFQDALEPQWGFRPDVFTNAYAYLRNEIYMLDDAEYYAGHQRCMDDSVAHELTHYVQVKYQNYDLNDESLEWDAVEVQTWFRDQFCKL